MLAFLDKIPYGTPRLRRILFWLLTAFTAYVLIGFLIVPPVLKSVILTQFKTTLHREGKVDRVAFNPLTLRLEVDGLVVNKLKGDGNLFSVDKIDASAGLATLWRFAPVIAHLHLRSPQLDITFFGDGKYSISDLIGARDPDKRETEPAEKEKGTVFPFALYGFEMTNATIVFDDQPHEKKHVISQFDLLVPFTSSFMNLRKEFTQPKFSAVVNGDPINLTGRTLPFDETLLTEFKLGAVDVDLHQYWTYLPIETPLTLQEGRFTSEISLFFERPDAERLNLFLGGGGKLTNFKLADRNDGTVFSIKELDFQMEKYSLGDNEMELKSVTLDEPYFKIIRHKNNAINWAGYFPSAPKDETAKKKDDTSLILGIQKITLKNGKLDWQDQAVEDGFKRVFGPLNVTADNFSTQEGAECSFSASAGKKENLTLSGTASLSPLSGNATLGGNELPVPIYAPYYAKALPMVLNSASLGFSVDVNFTQSKDGVVAHVSDGTISLKGLALSKPGTDKPSLALAELAVSGAQVDLKGRDVTLGEVRLISPDIKLVREKSGEIDLVKLFAADKDAKKVEQETKEALMDAPKPESDAPMEWTATVKAVRLTDGTFAMRDQTLKNPVTLRLNDIAVNLDGATTREGATIPYSVAARWGKQGKIDAKGKAELRPFKTNGSLAMRDLPLSPLDGFLGEYTELLFASGATTADLKYDVKTGDKIALSVTGKASLNEIQLKETTGGEFAGVDTLAISDIKFTGEPYHLDIGSIHLHGPKVSANIDEKGHSNIRRAFRLPQPLPETDDDATTGAKKTKDVKKQVVEKEEKESAPPTVEPDAPGLVTIGKIFMDSGEFRFRDASVAPPYSVDVTGMRLVLTDIAQIKDARPKMEFKANIGPTPLTINGVFNPLITPIYSDLAISVGGMEMVPLTPYTLRSLAYPIEKGRIYADIKFKTENWVLDADNKLFIEQLVLGPKDKRPGAPNVPVQFGLSLLQDGNGDMELHLPIEGRLDDPNFRIGGIVMRTIVSLFFKALASPFSLIGSIFGGGDDGNMDFVVFPPGRYTLDQAAKTKLDTIAKALKAREKLKLEVDGVIDPQLDQVGLERAIFEHKLKQQKYNSLSRKERAATTVDAMVIAPEEYEEFLFEAYKDEEDEFGVRPTTMFMVDRQPMAIMEKYVMDRSKATKQDMDELAVERARAVKEYIIGIEPSLAPRVFLLDKKKDSKGKTGVARHRADLRIK